MVAMSEMQMEKSLDCWLADRKEKQKVGLLDLMLEMHWENSSVTMMASRRA